MKTVLTIAIALTVCVASVYAQDEETQAAPEKKNSDMMGMNICRGVINTTTFWLEVPRCFWVETTRNPYYGFVVGTVNGSFLGVARAFGGVTDIITFGLTGFGIYGEGFPEYVWNSKWTAGDALVEQQKANVDNGDKAILNQ